MSGNAMKHDESNAIGLVRIWAEGQGVDSVSMGALSSHVVRRAYENVRRSPVTSSLTVITIAVALFLLGVFALLVHNATLAVANEGGEVMVTVFLKDTVAASDVKEITAKVTELAGDSPVSYTDKDAALEEFRKLLGQEAAILEGLENENPLPASLTVKVSSAEAAERMHEKISTAVGTDPRIDSIRFSRGVVQQIKRILALFEVGGVVGIIFLLVITGFIIANTIKLALYSHRMEVEIMQLVGARTGAIYAPYVLEGAVQGLLGALSGLVLVFAVFLFMSNAMAQTELLSALFPSFEFLSLRTVVWIVVAGMVVGMAGSFFAVRRFLAEA